VGTDKRDRQKARRAARLEEAHRQYRRQRRRRRATGAVIGVAAIALLLFGVSFLFSNSGDDTASSTTTTFPLPTTTVAPVITAPPAGETLTAAACPNPDGSSPRTTTFPSAPPTCIDPAKTYTATVSTTKGDFTIALDPATAPIATNNFVVLAEYHYYDGLPFHRIVPGFTIQAGDATGDPVGTGSPGYTIDDELPADLSAYVPGTVATAVGADPNSAASQFFVYVGPNPLDGPKYSIFGQVSEGMDVVQAIASAGNAAGTGVPTEEVLIESVTITET
jgi:cyclophilin family peptidyl-prolyl cis-trans isomerase